MALAKEDSQMCDADENPLIGPAQATIATITVTGTYATDDTPIETAINSIIAALIAHGLIKAS